MKRIINKLAIILILTISLSGCFLKSVHPLVKDRDAVELQGISGIWQKDDQRWTFLKEGELDDLSMTLIQGKEDLTISMADERGDSLDASNHLYFIIYEDLSESEIDSSYFVGKFVNLNNNFYLDLYPFDFESFSFEGNHFIPVHTFSKVELHNDSLSINLFKDSWIEEQIRDNRVRIKHERINETVLITATTEELQKFITKYGNMAEAFREPITMKRVEP